MVSKSTELKGYRRYHGYDYSRGATLFVTIATAPRQMVFGRVDEDRVELNAFGLAAIRLSRRIPERDFPGVVERLMAACARGYTLASTFISPCERAVAQELIKREIPFVKMVPDPLAMVYRPKEDEPVLFGKGLYLLLSRVASEDQSRSGAWHGINDALAQMAEQGGVSLYVEPVRGRLLWRFSQS